MAYVIRDRPNNDARAALAKRRAQSRAQAVRDPRLSHAGFRLFYIIGEHLNHTTGDAWPSQATLAGLIGLSERQVRRLIGDLIRIGYLEVSKAGGSGTDRYRIPTGSALERPDVDVRPSEGVTGHSAPRDRTPVSARDRTPMSAESSLGESSRKNPPERSDGFSDFWEAYPRQVGEHQARREYARALKHITSDQLVRAARRYCEERASENPKYTKMPANWLRDRCWANFDLRPDPEPADRKRLVYIERDLDDYESLAAAHSDTRLSEEFEEAVTMIDHAIASEAVHHFLEKLSETTLAEQAEAVAQRWSKLPDLKCKIQELIAEQTASPAARHAAERWATMSGRLVPRCPTASVVDP